MTQPQISRRQFLKVSAAGAAALALSSTGVMASARAIGANERLRVGVIGVGDRMRGLMGEFHNLQKDLNCEIVAISDIWRPNLISGVKTITNWYGKPEIYPDYRDMLASDNIDAVIIGTADFQHARMLTDAILAGKHAYCEKPTANNLEDANILMKTAEANPDVIVQVGTQRRSEGVYHAAAEFLQSGQLGTISRVNVSWNYFGARWRRNCDNVKPEEVDWNAFLLHTPRRDFDARVFREWRLFRPYSTGIPCQWMSHMTDAVHMVTGAQFPLSCVAQGGTYVWKDGRQNGDTFIAVFEYPEGFLLNYTTGFGNSAGGEFTFYGTNGKLDGNSWKATGDGGGGESRIKEEISIESRPDEDHMRNWVECVRAGKQPNAPVITGYQHAIAVVMAARALDTGRKQFFDPKTRRIYEV